MAHRPYRITDVTVVDPRDGGHATHRDVHVTGGRISAVTATGGDDRGGDTVEGGGRYVVPGFNDMHAHPLAGRRDDHALSLMLASGITGFRQMGGSADLLRRRRLGRLDLGGHAPRLVATAGSLLTPLNAATPAVAVAEARRQAEDGADFLKAGLISPSVYFAVQREAHALGLPVLGHLPAGIDVRAASSAGFRCIEHVGPGLGVLAGCSCHEDQLLAAARGPDVIPRSPVNLSRIPGLDAIFVRLMRRTLLNPIMLTTPAELDNLRRAAATFDQDRCAELAGHFVANETWNCPTLIRVKAQAHCADPAFAADPDLRVVPRAERRSWLRAAERFQARFDDAARAILADQFAAQQRVVGIFAARGVPLLSGTDTGGAAWVVPGASLHDEFDLLAEAGLTALQVLRSTTVEPARFLHRERTAGTVEVGKDADLVLLDADPTVAVANLHTVSGVVADGVHHSRADLTALTDQAARAA